MTLMHPLTLIILLLFIQSSFAQNAAAELHFESAEKAFNNGDYKEALRKLDDTEKLTGLMSKTLYLRIVSQDKLLEQSGYQDEGSLELLTDLISHVDTYLEVMAEQGLDDRYREVYAIKEKTGEVLEFAEWGAMPEYKNGRAAAESENYGEALDWYRQAADKGNARAINNIGVLYLYGHGVDQDYREAMVWFQKSAEKGLAVSMSNIGNLYYHGQGVSQDYKEAFSWYKKAAEKGHSTSMAIIGYLYAQGQGVNQDDKEAEYWYKKAAELGNISAMTNLGTLYNQRQEPVEAFKWYKQAAEKGNPYAMHNIGILYVKGEGVTQDYIEAMKWLKKAYEAGDATNTDATNTNVKMLIAYLYEHGLGVPKDKKMAAEWRTKP